MLVPVLLGGLVTGPDHGAIRSCIALAEMAVVLVWSFTASGRGPSGPALRWVIGLGAAWMVAMGAATAGAAHLAPAALRTAEWVAHVLFAVMLWIEFQRDPGRIRVMQAGIVIGFAVTVALIGWEAVAMSSPSGHNWRIHLPYLGHIRHLSIYSMVGVVFSARALLDVGATDRARLWAFAGLTFACGVLVWTGGRASVGAAALAAAVLWWLGGPRRWAFAKAFVAAATLGTALSLVVTVERTGLWRMIGISAENGVGQYTSGRTSLWQTALDAWREGVWFGAGPDASVYLLAPFGHTQPHNVVIQSLVEWGAIGAAPFLALLGGLIVHACRTARRARGRERAWRAVAAAFLIGATANAMLDGVLYDARTLMLTAAVAASVLVPVAGRGVRLVPVSTGLRAGVRALALAIVALFALHLTAVRAVWTPETPSPGSARVALLQAFPSPSHLRTVGHWVTDWQDEHPEAALDLARWGARHSPLPWYFVRREADLLLARGDRAGAEARFERALALEDEALRYH